MNDERFFRLYGFAKNLYRKTGIQMQSFNTLFQLEAMKRETKQAIPAASSFLMIPDWFHYKLTRLPFQRVYEHDDDPALSPAAPEISTMSCWVI